MINKRITLFSEIKKYIAPALYAFIISSFLLISTGNKDLLWLKDIAYNFVIDVSVIVISILSLILYFAFSSFTYLSTLMLDEYPVIFVFLSIYFGFIVCRLHFEKQLSIFEKKDFDFSNKMTEYILLQLFLDKKSNGTEYTISSSVIYILVSLFITSLFAFFFLIVSTSLLRIIISYGVSLTPDATSIFYGVSKFFYDGTAYIFTLMSEYSNFPLVTMVKNIFPFLFFAESIILTAFLVDKHVRKSNQ